MSSPSAADIRKALVRGEFSLAYQPILNIETKQVCCCEALLRWLHPTRGNITPDTFIPIAEKSGSMVPLGAWALRQACVEAMTWPEHIRVAVNVSTVQLRNDRFFGTVSAALRHCGLSPDRLELEVTESILSGEDGAVLDVLRRIQSLGVHIALDDFGTGYSSLNYLRRFAFNKIKIDRSFVQNLASDHAFSRPMLRAVARLANALGASCTAEGVETQEQLALIRAEGCTEAQGYLISRPKSQSDLGQFLADQLPLVPASKPLVKRTIDANEAQAEERRLRALYDYDVLDTAPEDAFDRITRLAARILDAPVALISLVDRDRQWFKSSIGLEITETPRQHSFCTHTIQNWAPLIVPDATLDQRFCASPLVVDPPYVRAYAGVPLRSATGHNVGALCINDTKPRNFSAEQIDLLRDLARLAVDELELRRLHSNDVLTGALNAVAFKAQVNSEIALARQQNSPLSCIMLELTNLERVNTDRGYSVGDSLLVQTAVTCLERTNSRCVFGRLSGTRFAALIPGIEESVARGVVVNMGERLAQLTHQEVPTDDVSARFGVSTLTPSVAGAKELLALAVSDMDRRNERELVHLIA